MKHLVLCFECKRGKQSSEFVQPVVVPMENSGHFPQGKPTATESRYPTLINYKVHSGFFRVSVIHLTLTWITGSLTCVRDHSYARAYKRGLDTPTSQNIMFDSEKLSQFFLVLLTRFPTSSLWIWSPTLYQLSHPVTPLGVFPRADIERKEMDVHDCAFRLCCH